MRFRLQDLFLPKKVGASTSAAVLPPAIALAAGAQALRYPPADAGLPVLTADELLHSNADIIARLRTHAALSPELFEQRFLQPLRRLASYINALPATASGLFSGEMGLLRAAVECAFFSFQASDGRIFTGSEGVERRHLLEGRWRYLCFLAGLFYPLGKPLERLVVAGPDGAVWKRHLNGVTDWAATAGATRLFVSWGSTEEAGAIGPSNAVLAIVPGVCGADNVQMLDDGAAELVAALYAIAAAGPSTARVAGEVVSGAWQRIMDREAARRPLAFGRVVSGTHMGPYLVGAARALVEQGVWKPNGENSCLVADAHGLYLRWPDAARDLIEHGVRQNYPGWPADAPTMAALLRAASLVTSSDTDMGTIDVVDHDGVITQALKIANPLSLLEDYEQYATAGGKTLAAVLAADPLARSEAAAQPTVGKAPAATTAAAAPAPTAPQAVDPEDQQPDTPPAKPAAGPAAQAAATPSQQGQKSGGALSEAPDVRYADLVPEDIRQDVGSALQAELLGKVVMAWRNKGDRSEVMRRVDEGAAISMTFLTENMRDAVTWIDNMARVGLIYSPKEKPGLRVHRVCIPEGRKPDIPAVILSNLACKRLGL